MNNQNKNKNRNNKKVTNQNTKEVIINKSKAQRVGSNNKYNSLK